MTELDLHTGSPFWPLRDGLLGTYPKLQEPASADVLVVGAGITGAVTAYELARSGASVIVVDRRDAGSGSSAASSGLLLYETDTSLEELGDRIGTASAARVYRLGLEAIDYIETFCRGAEHDCGFSRRPSLYLASKRSHVRQLQREHRLRADCGLQTDWLDRDAIREVSRFSAPAAIRVAGTAEVDCYRLTHQLLRAAEHLGARIVDRTPVTFPGRREGTLVATTAEGYGISASHVVWATGYEGSEWAAPHATLASTWLFVTEPLLTESGWPDRCLVWETARPYLYVRRTDDGRMMVGGEDENCAECHRSQWRLRRKTKRLMKRAQALFPDIPLELAYAWAGTFSQTDDGLPIIEELEAHPGVWVALGYGGNGITFGVIAARIIHAALVGRPSPDAPIFRRTRGPKR
jgi:glycine/D-amino acid oxidase-like deaminating enzyme